MSSKQQNEATEEDAVHPMVPVPDAIRIVLTQTAKSMLKLTRPSSYSCDELTERIKIDPSTYNNVIGRVLAHDIKVPQPGYPPYNASIMDGYAISSSEKFGNDHEWTHEIIDHVYAGDDFSRDGGGSIKQTPSQIPFDELAEILPKAVYITTGAVVPSKYDTVVPVEECVVSENRLQIKTPCKNIESGAWIRPVGCDMAAES
eukprot:14296982-Ditylum_brightwellii.AAC.1